ncbi:MAG: uncharacterized protein KVP18_002490 [Porospora cf. gigantea A]|uniref:uncharacterized protein n=1 Tax=Porospora cf. gigantea A TaxID=2853593 RepID=UPI003559FE2B|nr:MAG: hypothetical protein KVP18_002490 [Porospora cf. gigantea A]
MLQTEPQVLLGLTAGPRLALTLGFDLESSYVECVTVAQCSDCSGWCVGKCQSTATSLLHDAQGLALVGCFS